MADMFWDWLIKEAAFLRKIKNARIQAKIVEHDRAMKKRLQALPSVTGPIEGEALRGGRTYKKTVDGGQIEELT